MTVSIRYKRARRHLAGETYVDTEMDIAHEVFVKKDNVPRFMLLERCVHTGNVWPTFFDSPEDAANYRDGQEYPEDYTIDGLYDLDTPNTKLASTTSFTEP